MNVKVIKSLVCAAALAAAMLGCNALFQQAGGGDGDGGGGAGQSAQGGFSQVDSEFSDAPVSPGGTGGVVVIEDDKPAGEETRSFFTAFQIDPRAEDSAGPKFIDSGDIDKDGLPDFVTGWNQSQPIQLHLQRRDEEGNLSFRTITVAGTSPTAIMAGVELGQLDDDNGDGVIDDDDWLDIVVLVKATGFVTICPTVPPSVISASEGEIVLLFSPGDAAQVTDGDTWTQRVLVNPFIRCRRGTSGERWIHNQYPGHEEVEFEEAKTHPENNGFASLRVANIDGREGDDVLVALNAGRCEELGQDPPINTVDLWVNPGPGASRIPNQWGAPFFSADPVVDASCTGPTPVPVVEGVAHPYSSYLRVPVSLMTDAPQIRDIEVMDVDGDGDLDVIAAVSNSISLNVRWVRNPLLDAPDDAPDFNAVVQGNSDGWRYLASGWDPRPVGTRDSITGTTDARPIGQVDTGADSLAIGDIDGDGFDDVMVRSSMGVVQWFRRPNALTVQPEFPPADPVPDRTNFPWPVFTLTEFNGQRPEAIAIGDLNNDGQVEVMVAAEGAVFWYDGTVASTVFDPWSPNTIIKDAGGDDTGTGSSSSGGGTSGGTSGGTGGGTSGGSGSGATPGAGVGVDEVDVDTVINALLVLDVDGDGKNDILGTLDRRSRAGLSDDRIVWYRNIRTEDEE